MKDTISKQKLPFFVIKFLIMGNGEPIIPYSHVHYSLRHIVSSPLNSSSTVLDSSRSQRIQNKRCSTFSLQSVSRDKYLSHIIRFLPVTDCTRLSAAVAGSKTLQISRRFYRRKMPCKNVGEVGSNRRKIQRNSRRNSIPTNMQFLSIL